MSYDVTTIGAENGWRIVPHGAHVVQAWPPDADSPLALKSYNNPEAAQREYAVLRALRDFGVNLGPEALAIQTEQETPQVLMSWLEAAPLARPPAPDEDALWHRLMAAFGAPGEMSFATYTRPVPMQGHGIQNPADIYRQIERILPAEVPESATLRDLLERAMANIPEQWADPVLIGLCRRAYALDKLLWDGYHILAIGWENADWGDLAAELGLWSTHPDWEHVPSTHWVWVRWEFARLSHADRGFVPRATIYARLGWLYWASKLLAAQSTPPSQPETERLARYIQRAAKAIG